MPDARATATEFLDQPDCDPALAAASYRFMERVNGCFGEIRIVRHYVAAETALRPIPSPLRILDIGSGSCDIPLAVSRWARANGLSLHFTCLEKAGPAVCIARRHLDRAGDPAVHLIEGDIFTHQPTEPYDCAVASMCFHHFSNAQILMLLQRLRGFVISGVLTNDLRRSPRAWLAARLLLAVTGASEKVRHDALLSIRRGFKVSELTNLLRQLNNATVSVKPARWFRIAATIRFNRGQSL
ncbi:MAG: methyltransferase domain-containing protein [Lentisphaerae bacterium]|nr:methyltransferase domain-containing protein [Lentisphaerota bacterium]